MRLCYDNGGKTADRYTIVYTDMLERVYTTGATYYALAASENPFHPLGIGQQTTARIGSHLGRRIAFKNLPADVQKFVKGAL